MRFALHGGVNSARTVLIFAWASFDPVECAFWRRLAAALARRGLHLVLATPSAPPDDLGIDHLAVPPTLDDLSPFDAAAMGSVPVSELGLDPDALLAREAIWAGPPVEAAVEDARRQALGALAAFWTSALGAMRPAAVLIWNGQHVAELILTALCRRYSCPVLFVERAPIPRALFVDERGLSTASRVAAEPRWQPRDGDRWRSAADRVAARVRAGNFTAWEQPPSRGGQVDLQRALGVAPGQRVLLFAGQVDADTQRFLFSPHFPDNLSAFRAFLQALAGRRDVFVLGKQHPRSGTPARLYAEALRASGLAGAWREDVSIDDALDAADRACAVNSTVLYEALAREIPVLALGDWLLAGRGTAVEIASAHDLNDAVARWLDGVDSAAQQAAWRNCLAYLLEHSLYALEPAEVAGGMQGAAELAERMRQLTGSGSPAWSWRDAWRARQAPDTWSAGAPWWDRWQWQDAARRRHGTAEDLGARADRWRAGMWIRHVVLQARAAAAGGRPVFIWGAGAGGRSVAARLTMAGVHVAGYVESTPRAARLGGVPVLASCDLAWDEPRGAAGLEHAAPFVFVASVHHAEITPQLERLGAAPSRDYLVVDTQAFESIDLPEAEALAC